MTQGSVRLTDTQVANAAVNTAAAPTGPNSRLQLLRSEAAWRALSDRALWFEWRALQTQCPNSTVFQSPEFVQAWCSSYAPDWEPLLLVERDAAGQLSGLWTLASRGGQLVHAGAQQAEYHCWLALPDRAVVFVASAWRLLCMTLPGVTLRLRYLPDRAVLHALASEPWMRERMRWRTVARPLMRLRADEIRKSMAKKSNKSRVSRLKRLGELSFEPIESAEALERVLPALVASYDFRQGAVNQTSPFREDARKMEFHRLLFAAGKPTCLLSVTFLSETPIAAFWGSVTGSMLHLGMLIHSPMLAEHSPGKLHLQQLAESLLGTGIDTIDLTPGGDPWKERFANDHDEVHDLTLYAKPSQARRRDWRESAEESLKRGLARIGLLPDQVRDLLKRLRRLRPAALLGRFGRWVSEQRELRIYRLAASEVGSRQRDERVREDSIEALLDFEPGETWQTRQGFLSAALARLEAGERAFTISQDGRLATSGWLVPRQQRSRMSEVEQTLILPPNSATLYDFYTDPAYRGRGLYGAAIEHMLAVAFADPTLEHAYISVLSDNLASRKVIERAGFRYLGSFHWRCRLGRISKAADSCFDASEDADANA